MKLTVMIDIIGCGFQTKQRYRFGWFSMKLKLVGGDSAGIVTAYYVSTTTVSLCSLTLLQTQRFDCS